MNILSEVNNVHSCWTWHTQVHWNVPLTSSSTWNNIFFFSPNQWQFIPFQLHRFTILIHWEEWKEREKNELQKLSHLLDWVIVMSIWNTSNVHFLSIELNVSCTLHASVKMTQLSSHQMGQLIGRMHRFFNYSFNTLHDDLLLGHLVSSSSSSPPPPPAESLAPHK